MVYSRLLVDVLGDCVIFLDIKVKGKKLNIIFYCLFGKIIFYNMEMFCFF